MGTLRFLFALSVVFAHSAFGFVMVGGHNAVQLFYIISGFLISYVLLGARSYRNLRSFYLNRFLRLYPIYIIVAVATLVVYLISGKNQFFLDTFRQAPLSADLLLITSNLFLFAQDWVMFAGVENGHLVFARDFLASEVLLFHGLIVPQAWTLGVELSFYLVAPFVLGRKKWIGVLLLASLGLRAALIVAGIGTRDPWTYRFFPTELAFFLFGALAHQILLPFYVARLKADFDRYAVLASGFLVALTLGYSLIPLPELAKSLFMFAIFCSLLPFAFAFQKRSKIDNWIGNLSYPLYIGHMLATWITSYALGLLSLKDAKLVSLACAVSAIGLAMLLNQFVGLPFERLRNRIRSGGIAQRERRKVETATSTSPIATPHKPGEPAILEK